MAEADETENERSLLARLLNPFGALVLERRLAAASDAELERVFDQLAPHALFLLLSNHVHAIFEIFIGTESISRRLGDLLAEQAWSELERLLSSPGILQLCHAILGREHTTLARSLLRIVPHTWWPRRVSSLLLLAKAIDNCDSETVAPLVADQELMGKLWRTPEGFYCSLRLLAKRMDQANARDYAFIVRAAADREGGRILIDAILYGDILVNEMIQLLCARSETCDTAGALVTRLLDLSNARVRSRILECLCSPKDAPLISRIRASPNFPTLLSASRRSLTQQQYDRLLRCLDSKEAVERAAQEEEAGAIDEVVSKKRRLEDPPLVPANNAAKKARTAVQSAAGDDSHPAPSHHTIDGEIKKECEEIVRVVPAAAAAPAPSVDQARSLADQLRAQFDTDPEVARLLAAAVQIESRKWEGVGKEKEERALFLAIRALTQQKKYRHLLIRPVVAMLHAFNTEIGLDILDELLPPRADAALLQACTLGGAESAFVRVLALPGTSCLAEKILESAENVTGRAIRGGITNSLRPFVLKHARKIAESESGRQFLEFAREKFADIKKGFTTGTPEARAPCGPLRKKAKAKEGGQLEMASFVAPPVVRPIWPTAAIMSFGAASTVSKAPQKSLAGQLADELEAITQFFSTGQPVDDRLRSERLLKSDLLANCMSDPAATQLLAVTLQREFSEWIGKENSARFLRNLAKLHEARKPMIEPAAASLHALHTRHGREILKCLLYQWWRADFLKACTMGGAESAFVKALALPGTSCIAEIILEHAEKIITNGRFRRLGSNSLRPFILEHSGKIAESESGRQFLKFAREKFADIDELLPLKCDPDCQQPQPAAPPSQPPAAAAAAAEAAAAAVAPPTAVFALTPAPQTLVERLKNQLDKMAAALTSDVKRPGKCQLFDFLSSPMFDEAMQDEASRRLLEARLTAECESWMNRAEKGARLYELLVYNLRTKPLMIRPISSTLHKFRSDPGVRMVEAMTAIPEFIQACVRGGDKAPFVRMLEHSNTSRVAKTIFDNAERSASLIPFVRLHGRQIAATASGLEFLKSLPVYAKDAQLASIIAAALPPPARLPSHQEQMYDLPHVTLSPFWLPPPLPAARAAHLPQQLLQQQRVHTVPFSSGSAFSSAPPPSHPLLSLLLAPPSTQQPSARVPASVPAASSQNLRPFHPFPLE